MLGVWAVDGEGVPCWVCGLWMVRVSRAGSVWSVDGEGAPCQV